MLKVEVCCGTSCYIMGAFKLLEPGLTQNLDIEVKGLNCMNICKSMDKRPPYIRVNGNVYSEVTPEKLLGIIKEHTDDL